jgi:hypothetical protein
LIENKEVGAIINAYHTNRFLGGLLIVRGGRTAFTSKFVVSANSKTIFPTLRLAPSVFFEGILWAKAQGCESMDLEGYSATNSGAPDRIFINRYKAGFNPNPIETLGQYHYICNNTIFQLQRVLGHARQATRIPQRLTYKMRFELKKRLVKLRENKN